MRDSSCDKLSVFHGKMTVFLNSNYVYLNNGHLWESSVDRYANLIASTFLVKVILHPRPSCLVAAVGTEYPRAEFDLSQVAVVVAVA
jgi:hypothetical protein